MPYDDHVDPEGPSASDLERFGSEFRTCPECGSEVYDQADICQACGHVFAQPGGGLPLWAVIAAIVVLAAFGLVFVF
ncbi:MAG: hypothetical protein AAGI17_10930 [Planctomycetota bacterium]